jgi:hypothetical protein
MIPTAQDTDGTHPLERIAIALEIIAEDLHKIANPAMVMTENGPEYIKRCG